MTFILPGAESSKDVVLLHLFKVSKGPWAEKWIPNQI